jgi:hypothetical protein
LTLERREHEHGMNPKATPQSRSPWKSDARLRRYRDETN